MESGVGVVFFITLLRYIQQSCSWHNIICASVGAWARKRAKTLMKQGHGDLVRLLLLMTHDGDRKSSRFLSRDAGPETAAEVGTKNNTDPT